ncbi:MAG: FixH family protein [Pikeienuella sp.]|uniref:FixH family protein n=1 Tax=Pikeienuella sp. TaxID=2831957 RepID=UPI003919E29D
MAGNANTGKPLTGRFVFFCFAGAFGAILAANIALAVAAVGSFPGIEVKNGYVASQSFERERAAQVALGWSAKADYADGRLVIRVTDRMGDPAPLADFALRIGRPTTEAFDVTPEITETATMESAEIELAPGLWRLDVKATGRGGESFRQHLVIEVKG